MTDRELIAEARAVEPAIGSEHLIELIGRLADALDVSPGNSELIAEAKSFLGGAGQATLLGRATAALVEAEENAEVDLRVVERLSKRARRLDDVLKRALDHDEAERLHDDEPGIRVAKLRQWITDSGITIINPDKKEK